MQQDFTFLIFMTPQQGPQCESCGCGERNEPQANELKEAEQLHGPEPHSKSALGRAGLSWNQTKEFSSSLWWVPVESFSWLEGTGGKSSPPQDFQAI